MRYIRRACEEVLKNKFKTSKAVAITGARQVGKTTLTKHISAMISLRCRSNIYNNGF